MLAEDLELVGEGFDLSDLKDAKPLSEGLSSSSRDFCLGSFDLMGSQSRAEEVG